jgi:hypothetical protein
LVRDFKISNIFITFSNNFSATIFPFNSLTDFVADFAGFKADFVAENTKPLENKGGLKVDTRCRRDWLRRTLSS